MKKTEKEKSTVKFRTQTKPVSTASALILLLALSVLSASVSTANAHTPAWTIPTYAYLTISPNPIGTGQTAVIVMWVDWPPPSANGFTTGYRWQNMKVEVTKPDGARETLGPFISDPVGGAYALYTPTQVGTYSFVFKFQEQVLVRDHPITGAQGSNSEYINDTFLSSTSNTMYLTVQKDPITAPRANPLPTEYWTRPIEGQNLEWAKIASNWLWKDRNFFQPDGAAPESAHIMWTKPINDGGVAGGTIGESEGINYYSGMAYNARFANPLIIYGRLYYELPNRNSASGGGYICVDLRTGEEIWYIDASPVPSFGAVYDYEDPNQHGVIPNGILYTNNFARAIDPLTGRYWYNMTNVPSGQETRGIDGEILRYVINYQARWLAQWNVSKVETTSTSGSLNASTPNRYDWNVTIPTTIPADSHTLWAGVDDLLLGTNLVEVGIGGFFTRPDPYTVWAISLKPETRGQLLWTKNYAAAAGNLSQVFQRVDPENRVILFMFKENMLFSAYSLDDGRLLWEQKDRIKGANDFDYYDNTVVAQRASIAYGRVYYTGSGGILYCYDSKTGALQWTYGNGGAGNSTAMGFNGVYPYYPTYIYSIADGKVYLLTGEHSPNTPLYTNGLTRCVDAYTGKEIWTLTGWGGYPSRTGAAVAEGYFAYFNCYDSQIYCIGKGPSATSVTVRNDVIESGADVLVTGRVIDTASGTKQNAQSARFPNGVPAVSDESMKEWMEYVYMQKEKPNNVKGVSVHLTAIDPNGNFQDLGTAVSDDLGNYAIAWTPPVPGLYNVRATFDGTDSYYRSEAGTSFVVSKTKAAPAVVTPTPTATQPPVTPVSPTPVQTPVSPSPTQAVNPPTSAEPTTTYIAIGVAVIVIVAAAAALIIRKRK